MENFEKKIDNIIGKALNEAFGSRGEELAT